MRDPEAVLPQSTLTHTPPITLFFDALILFAQTKEPTVARAILTPHACSGIMVRHLDLGPLLS